MSRQLVLWESGAFSVTAKGLKVTGQPEVQEWAAIGARLGNVRSGVQWAIGDWLLYGDQRGYDEGQYETAAEATGLKRGTLMNLKSIAKAFPKAKRNMDLPWSHYALVAGFEESEREDLLRRAKREGLSYDELRGITQDLRHAARMVQQSWPDGTYGIILADPPWTYNDGTTDPTRRIDNQYPTMTVDQIAALAPHVQRVMAPDCVTYLWATNPLLEDALKVVSAWGLTYKTNHVWVKQMQGMGYWTRGRHELLLVCTRGNPLTPADNLRPDSVIVADRGAHSAKPPIVYDMLERMYASAPKLELFARTAREGWTAWGNELAAATAEGPHRAIRMRDQQAVPA